MPVAANTPRLILEGVSAHNLKNVSVELPLGRLVCVTGVSGSGKSTLVQDVLYPALLKQKGKPTEAPAPSSACWAPSRSPTWSWWTRPHRQDRPLQSGQLCRRLRRDPQAVRAGAAGARARLHRRHLQLQRRRPLPDLRRHRLRARGDAVPVGCHLRCPDCDGKRFRPEVLEVRVEHLGKSASIDEVLEMTVSEALDFFKGLRDVQTRLAPLGDVGLEYVRLGQPVPTLSGGEAQRLKLAGHLAEAARSGISTAKVAKKGSLFLFDEPTTGLHFDDVARLMRAFRKRWPPATRCW